MNSAFFLLIIVGFLMGIFSTLVGGSMFFSVPFLQWLFPSSSFGVVVGNIKVGILSTALTSSIKNRKHIHFLESSKIALIAFLGTVLGTSIIAELDQKWLFFAILLAVLITIYAPRIARLITPKLFVATAFALGVYAGFFGAGVGIILTALIRIKHPEDGEIASVKIQTRFIEGLLSIVAVMTHFLYGNLVISIWGPWAIGSIMGGYVGGVLLNRMQGLSGSVQKYILYAAFVCALGISGYKAFFQ